MIKCPKCGGMSTKVLKEWKYSVFDAKLFMCQKCGKSSIAYFRGGKLSHTIPKQK